MSTTDLRAFVSALLEAHPDGILPLVQLGQPVLRAEAADYEGQLGDLLPDFLHALHMTMLDAPGVGVAAPQVGVPLKIAVMRDPGTDNPEDTRERTAFEYRVIINPRYEPVGEREVSFYEGCLSFEGYQGVVARAHQVRLLATDENGEEVDEVLTGWPARIAQHETDHLYGIVYVDKAETRSLSSTDNLVALWSQSTDPDAAASALDFPVAQRA
ncbi:peptide deformylase [Timonella senegalensis]|uniref:peptide deformylase n=1 Tax=Timonella senegalensis TaxID=1465825 RepID=UPI00031B3CB2|nr:peptide deformylase [Timonella senegalensis]